jgi:hypothetical protein
MEYGFNEIQRYLSGAMTAAERHELELAALKDPLLADALEGFKLEGANFYERHKEEIIKTILQPQSIPVQKRETKKYGLAVAVTLLLVAGMVFIKLLSDKSANHESLAKDALEFMENKIPSGDSPPVNFTDGYIRAPKNVAPLTGIPTGADTGYVLTLTDERTANVQLENERFTAVLPADSVQLTQNRLQENEGNRDRVVFGDNNTHELNSFKVEIDKQVRAKSDANDESDMAGNKKNILKPYIFSGLVIDHNRQPLANTFVTLPNGTSLTSTDGFGRFQLLIEDSLEVVKIVNKDFITQQVILEPLKQQRKVFQLSPASYSNSEVVITSFGKKATLKESDNQSDDGQQYQPQDGWLSFQEYVRQHLGKDSTSFYANDYDQFVNVEFSLDRNGKPFNIQFSGKVSDSDKIKAKDMLINGPHWTRRYKKRIKTTIPIH